VICQISLIVRSPNVSLTAFRNHWLDPHGTQVARRLKLRRYWQSHVVESPLTNALARKLDIAGFPELWFDTFDDLYAPYPASVLPEREADAEAWLRHVGAVSRVATEPTEVIAAPRGSVKAFILKIGDRAGGEAWAEAYQQRVTGLPGVCGYLRHKIVSQGGPTGTHITELDLPIAGIAEVSFPTGQAMAKCAGELAGSGADAGDIALYVVQDYRYI
jgi:hypothetical protein